MPVTGKPSVTANQVGATVYFISPYTNRPAKDTVLSTSSIVTDKNTDNTGEQEDTYYLTNYGNLPFPASKLYASESALKTAMDSLMDALDP